MKHFRLENVNLEKIDSLINLCVPPERRSDRFFIEGMKVKKIWASKSLEKFWGNS